MADRLKDRFFQEPFFDALTAAISRVHRAFDRARFFQLLHAAGWEELELKARMRRASEALGQTLPRDYRRALAVLLAVEEKFEGFDHLLFADFVERFGEDEYQASISALERFTRSSAEFAVRPFIEKYPERTMAQMLAWSRSSVEAVRRLSSEGCRPRLPWGRGLPALKRDPSPILPILENLKDDPSEWVRRSVANNLGDIAKDHPALALQIAGRWLAESPARAPLAKHALRGLLKKGDRKAMRLFGFGRRPRVKLVRLEVSPARVRLGGAATLQVALRSEERRAQTVRLEYVLGYARPGGRTSQKVFRIAEAPLRPGQPLELARKLDFRDRTIRKHHRGRHTLTLCVNGERLETVTFSLV